MTDRQFDTDREAELDAMIEDWIATCACDTCERYRKSFAIRSGQYAARIEEQLKARRA
jgi:hypothetical protein